MSEKKILTFDISELSPLMQFNLVEKMTDYLQNEAAGIAIDLRDYSEGKIKNEMLGWANAATTLVYDIRTQFREGK
jgi:hypothetical protein